MVAARVVVVRVRAARAPGVRVAAAVETVGETAGKRVTKEAAEAERNKEVRGVMESMIKQLEVEEEGRAR